MTVVLCNGSLLSREIRIVCRTDWNMLRYRVATDDKSTGMYAGTTNIALQHSGIFDGVCKHGVGTGLCLLQFHGTLDGIGKVHLQILSVQTESVRNGFAKCISFVQRQFLNSGHILYTVLSGHGGVCDDVGAVLLAVLVHYPLEDTSSSIVVKVGIYIRQ